MPTLPLTVAITQVRRAVLAPDETDGGLLARFVRDRDDAAFRELVRRIGPMVLGVCRRVTCDTHLAEDAFQAAFLVLARRAATVVPREAVRGWVYGVAVRTARKARAMSARRNTREATTATLPEPPMLTRDEPDPDLLLALDEEVATLPDHLRAAVLLCEMEGLGRKDAAARLGVAEGTLSSRLAKARRVLADRLRRRGFALSAAGVGLILTRPASAVPPGLLSATAALADGSVPVPATVTSLSHGVFRTMFLTKLKGAVVGALVLAALGWAVGLPARPTASAGPPQQLDDKKPDEKKPQPAGKPAGAGTLFLARQGGLVALTPDGKEGDELTAPKGTGSNFIGRLSPDGKRVAFAVTQEEAPRVDPPETWPIKVVVRTFGVAEPVAVVDVPAMQVTLSWTADGSRVVVTKCAGTRLEKGTETVLIDPATGKTEALALPEGTRVLDCGRDGKTFLVAHWDGEKGRVGLVAKGDKEVRALAELKGRHGNNVGRLSPDGKRVLYTDADPDQKDANKWGMSAKPYLLDVATGKRTDLAEFPGNARCMGVTWSPDGRRVAYTWTQLHAEVVKKDELKVEDTEIETGAFLVVADADGKNAKTVSSAKDPWALKLIFGSIDWR